MAGGKQTPRQRMINILYLVLLGLIALNVPDNLLDAFKKITDSLTNSTKNVQSGITTTFDTFEKTKLKEQPERAKPIFDKAKLAQGYSDDLYNYVEELKKHLIDNTDGIDPKTGDYKGRDNMDVTPNYMITDGKAKELKTKINETRTKLISVLDPKDTVGLDLSLSAEDPKDPKDGKNTWELASFGEGIPMGAAITTLAKIQSDVKNAESAVVKKELGKIDVAVVTLDQFAAVAVAPSSYVIAGTPYTASIFLTAYDSKSNPDISIDGSRIQTSGGKGTYTVNTSKEGIFKYKGSISVKGTDGKIKSYPLPEQTYQVAKPSAVVSPDKMNVLYIGVENPLSVSAPGVPLDKLRVSMSSGSLSGSNGHYMASVKSVGETKVTISGEIIPGKPQVLGTSNFRIKRIPDPVAQFAGRNGGSTSAVNLRAQDKVFAHLDDFAFDLKFNVTHFTLYIRPPRQDATIMKGTGAELNAQMKAAMATIRPGTQIYFDDIIAVGPDGSQRSLAPIIITAN